MRCTDPGHTYLVNVLDGEPGETTEIKFVKREGEKYPGNVGTQSGTTMQELLRACIDRAYYVNSQIPCDETIDAIEAMKEAIFLFESRAARRHNRKLVGGPDQATFGYVCGTCGHVQCQEHR